MADHTKTETPDEKAKRFLSGSKIIRQWLYRITIATMLIIALWVGGYAITTENWSELVIALLNLGGAGSAAVALDNVSD